MNYWHAVIFGVVEGVTEFLPISSTGHLILTGKLLGLPPESFFTTFDIVIQLGAIFAAVVLYWRKLLTQPKICLKVLIAFLPSMIIGLTLYRLIKQYLLDNVVVVLVSLVVGGVLLILFEKLHQEKESSLDDISSLSVNQALMIGFCQCLAMIPGVSRSAATICGGMLVGLKRKTVVEFSFLLAIPTMAAASALDLLKNAKLFSLDQIGFLSLGFVVSFFVALLSIQFLIRYIQKNDFVPFGVYRILVGILFWIFVLKP